MQQKFTRSNIIVWFLDLFLIAFLVFDFGFQNFKDFRTYKLIALPVLLLSLIAFNIHKYRSFNSTLKIKKTARVNLVLLSLLIVLEIISIITNYQGSFLDTFFKERYIIEYGLLFYFFTRLTFLMRRIYSIYFNPASLFVGSFALIALKWRFF